MFFLIIPASCILAWWLAKDAIKGKELLLDEENTDNIE